MILDNPEIVNILFLDGKVVELLELSRGIVSLTSKSGSPRPLLGVLGGAGPLASSAFLASVYEEPPPGPEQNWPRILLLSDPSLDDRTVMLRAGQGRLLAEAVGARLEQLEAGGAQFLLICCFTAHAVIPWLPARLQQKLVCLPDVALFMAAHRRQATLVLCTTGSRQGRLFESSPLWVDAAPYLTFPEQAVQERVHDLIYQLKDGLPPESGLLRLRAIIEANRPSTLLFACTELHLLSRARRSVPHSLLPEWLDPLEYLARAIRNGGWAVGCSPKSGPAEMGVLR